MPELPEAETIRRALQNILPGRRIESVEVFTPAMREPLLPLLTAELPGKCFTAIRRRGRYLLADLDDGRAALMHFGMSGVVRVEETG
jgi:formamidopyrimidine-DNA glycosylase